MKRTHAILRIGRRLFVFSMLSLNLVNVKGRGGEHEIHYKSFHRSHQIFREKNCGIVLQAFMFADSENRQMVRFSNPIIFPGDGGDSGV